MNVIRVPGQRQVCFAIRRRSKGWPGRGSRRARARTYRSRVSPIRLSHFSHKTPANFLDTLNLPVSVVINKETTLINEMTAMKFFVTLVIVMGAFMVLLKNLNDQPNLPELKPQVRQGAVFRDFWLKYNSTEIG